MKGEKLKSQPEDINESAPYDLKRRQVLKSFCLLLGGATVLPHFGCELAQVAQSEMGQVLRDPHIF